MKLWLRGVIFETIVLPFFNRLAEDKTEDGAALKLRIFDYLTHETFGLIDARDIYRTVNGQAYFNDQPIANDTREKLAVDALRWESSFLWKVLSRNLRYKAGQIIAYNSKHNRDILAGKMLLELVATQDEILDLIKNES